MDRSKLKSNFFAIDCTRNFLFGLSTRAYYILCNFLANLLSGKKSYCVKSNG